MSNICDRTYPALGIQTMINLDDSWLTALDALDELSVLTDITPPTDLSMIFSLRSQRQARGSLRLKDAKNDLALRITSASQMSRALAAIRSNLKLRLNAIENTLAPITILPVEIVRLIFLHLLSSQKSNRFAQFDALRISQVSRSWRTTALGCSAIWTRIHVDWHSKQQDLWLSRARYQTLDIVANCSNARTVTESHLQPSIKIWGARNRWISLSVYNYGYGDLQVLVKPALASGKDACAMKSIVLMAGSDAADSRGLLFGGHYHLPEVEDLRLSGVLLPPSSSTAQLIHLHLSKVKQSAAVISDVLNGCQKLQVLVIEDAEVDLKTFRGPMILMKSLVELRLTVRDAQSDWSYFIFKWIRAPNFHSFCLDVDLLPGRNSQYDEFLRSLEDVISLVRSQLVIDRVSLV